MTYLRFHLLAAGALLAACSAAPTSKTPAADTEPSSVPEAAPVVTLPAEVESTLAGIEGGIAEGKRDTRLSAEMSVEAVQGRLQRMVDLDQAMRKSSSKLFAQSMTNAQRTLATDRFFKAATAIDSMHTEELERFVEAKGWPKISVYGKQAANHAWLLAQHADRKPSFQERVLKEMAALLETGEADKKDYAYLWDRVAVAQKRPQRYGTQGRCVAKGRWEPMTIEEPADEIDTRRESVGLGTMTEYKSQFVKICPASDTPSP